MLASEVFDFIVVGGGIAGSVLCNRLHALRPEARVLLIEAGPDANDRADVLYVNSTNNIGGEFDWNYMSAPQTHLNGRSIQSAAGKALGGGSVINTCGWIRGNKVDYDEWAEVVGDDTWNYQGWLPYFKKAETFWSSSTNTDQHGHDGPLRLQVPSTTNRQYPLREAVSKAYESVGIKALPGLDVNAGQNLGFGENVEDRDDGKRQIASKYFPLDGVTVMTDMLVDKILISKYGTTGKPRAVGVQLADGTQIHGKEIIASAGAYRTPQLLMLSGIGPPETLAQFNITQHLDQPAVGQNLLDHIFYLTQWQLKPDFANGTVDSGNPYFAQSQFGLGQPNDFVATFTAEDTAGLAAAIAKDEGKTPDALTHPLLKNPRAFLEAFVLYVNLGVGLPSSASYLTLANVGLHPSSRGGITISSASASDPPVIDANFYSTETDRFVWREGMRKMITMMQNSDLVEGEVPPPSIPGLQKFEMGITDEQIDARIAATAIGTYHPMGTCTMGKVVDNELRVVGVDGLRVVDASVFAVPIAAHIQQAVYALGLKAADIIASA